MSEKTYICTVHGCNCGLPRTQEERARTAPAPEPENLDAMTDDELRAILKRNTDWSPTARTVRTYALRTLEARRHRLDGRVDDALRSELAAQKAYDALPEWARW